MRGATSVLSPTTGVPRVDVVRDHAVVVTPSQTVAPDQNISEGQKKPDTHGGGALADVIFNIGETYKLRVSYVRAMTKLINQMKAMLRRYCDGDKKAAEKLYKKISAGKSELNEMETAAAAAILPLIQAMEPLEIIRKQHERELERLAKSLPVWQWVEGVRGFGPLALAQIVGEAGDLSKYDGPAKLWKRMGLAVLDGQRQRRVAGRDEATTAEAIRHGYSPRRRSLMFVIGDAIVKNGDEYRQVYLDRKATEHQKALNEGLIPATTTASTVKSWEDLGLPALTYVKKLDPKKHRAAAHMNIRAQRYMEKRLLRNLWTAWRAFGRA